MWLCCYHTMEGNLKEEKLGSVWEKSLRRYKGTKVSKKRTYRTPMTSTENKSKWFFCWYWNNLNVTPIFGDTVLCSLVQAQSGGKITQKSNILHHLCRSIWYVGTCLLSLLRHVGWSCVASLSHSKRSMKGLVELHCYSRPVELPDFR